jgi:hypothetical protein
VAGSATVGDAREPAVWSRDRFVSLALGEVRRLRDDADGYGPRGAGFIGHVDLPADVEEAARRLLTQVEDHLRHR